MIIPYVAGQLLNEGLLGSRWQSFEGAGHSLPMEREAEFSAVLVDFLGSVTS
jgi:pimeloyl-ACP methyl ester carboxylesterase